MFRIVRCLTAVMLAVHVTVGCCAHHVHACEDQGHCPPGGGGTSPDGQCHAGHSSPAEHAHHGPHDCQGSKCSFIVTSQTAGNAFVQLSQVFFVPLLDDLSSLPGICCGQHFLPTGRLLLPVRLHLANQVLLI
jgi:hypothetical protein